MFHQASLIALLLTAGEPAPQEPSALSELHFTSADAAKGLKVKRKPDVLITIGVNDKTYLDTVVRPNEKRVVFVDFWASYCAPCLDELPGLQAMKERLAKEADVVFVNVDPPGTQLGKVLTKRNVRLATTFRVENDDPQPFINAVDPKWMGEVPFGALYDRSGKLVKTMSGEQKIEDIERAIREVIGR